MPAIVRFPAVVEELLAQFAHLFRNEPERIHFAEYLTGLIVAHHKNVSAIQREFAVAADQSCLNRWLTQADWDVQRLNAERLAWLQKDPATRYSPQGVIALDNTLVNHEGKLIEDVGYYWDHADKRYVVAHDYLIASYVCTSGKHYPLDFRRFVKKEQCAGRGVAFRDHTALFQDLIAWVVQQDIPGEFVFDCWFTHAANLNAIDAHHRSYVADLKFNRKIDFLGRPMKAEEVASTIPPLDRKAVEVDGKTQWYFTRRIRMNGVNHPMRILILWKHREDLEASKILVTNRTWWDVTRMLRVYRCRWGGTESFHRDGKQQLGMGDCQMRNGLGQTRHLYLVFLAYSALMRRMRQGRGSEWALERLTTIGQACAAVMREILGDTIAWAVDRAGLDGWTVQRIRSHLSLA
jgi:hypothetical protein